MLLTSITNAFIILKNFLICLQPTELPCHQLFHYQTKQSKLLAQRDKIAHQINNLDIAIQDILHLTSLEQRAPHQSPSTSLSSFRTSHPDLSRNSSPGTRTRTRNRQTSIGVPYPLPFTPL